jgi:hypothetical protein
MPLLALRAGKLDCAISVCEVNELARPPLPAALLALKRLIGVEHPPNVVVLARHPPIFL